MIVRPQQSEDYEAARHIYTEAFRQPGFRPPQNPGFVPPEVPLFETLWAAGDVLPEFSFTAEVESEAVGHATASKAIVGDESVVAVGPIGVLPEHQNMGVGSALMQALLTAADVARVPMVVLLGSPHYYSRFGFRPAEQLEVTSPEAGWGDAFQARPLTAYTSRVAGQFRFAPAFSP